MPWLNICEQIVKFALALSAFVCSLLMKHSMRKNYTFILLSTSQARIFLFAIILFLAACNSNVKQSGSKNIITDDLGNSFVFDKAPQRIISLAPNLTEMIYSLELQQHLVGNTM